MLKAAATLALLAACALPTTAKADATVSDLRNPHPSADRLLNFETTLAVKFWRARNVQTCPGGVATILADFSQLQTAGGSGCSAYFDSRWIAAARKREQRYYVDAEVQAECALVFHETGHAMGLPHTTTGVMAADVAMTPWDCRVLGHRLES
jgi:hypothetical protein